MAPPVNLTQHTGCCRGRKGTQSHGWTWHPSWEPRKVLRLRRVFVQRRYVRKARWDAQYPAKAVVATKHGPRGRDAPCAICMLWEWGGGGRTGEGERGRGGGVEKGEMPSDHYQRQSAPLTTNAMGAREVGAPELANTTGLERRKSSTPPSLRTTNNHNTPIHRDAGKGFAPARHTYAHVRVHAPGGVDRRHHRPVHRRRRHGHHANGKGVHPRATRSLPGGLRASGSEGNVGGARRLRLTPSTAFRPHAASLPAVAVPQGRFSGADTGPPGCRHGRPS
jgi:hypothetical protein